MRHLVEKTWRPRRALAVLAVVALALTAIGITPIASATLPQQPAVTLERTVSTRPFVGTRVRTTDHEGSAYVPRDRSLWLADDDGHALYEIDPSTGALKRTIIDEAREVVRRPLAVLAFVAIIDGEREEDAARMVDVDEGCLRDHAERALRAIIGMGTPADIGEEACGVAQALLRRRLGEALMGKKHVGEVA